MKRKKKLAPKDILESKNCAKNGEITGIKKDNLVSAPCDNCDGNAIPGTSASLPGVVSETQPQPMSSCSTASVLITPTSELFHEGSAPIKSGTVMVLSAKNISPNSASNICNIVPFNASKNINKQNIGDRKVSNASSLSTFIPISPCNSPLGLKISNVTSLKPLSDTVTDNSNSVSEIYCKGENLQQLSTNALPPYTLNATPLPQYKMSTPAEGYCCTDCGDTFVLKSSLTFHLERRSVLIKFSCESCKSVQMFYNRCSLLSHIRAHSDKEEPSDIRKAIVMPLPRVLMGGIHVDNLNTSEDECLNVIEGVEPTTPIKLLEVSISEPCSDQNAIEDDNETCTGKISKFACSECDKVFDSFDTREYHFTNSDKIPLMISQCSKCGMLCPSKCSLKAHQRIHLQVGPYVCPECGEKQDISWDEFQRHLKYKCFHFSRFIGYRCSVCERLSGTSLGLQRHISESHTEAYVKCQACPMAFKSAWSFQLHKKSAHVSAPDVQFKLIFKCALCDIVFLAKDQMLSHLDSHIKDQVSIFIFNCMECSKTTESKAKLLEHLKLSHQSLLKSDEVSSISVSSTKDGQNVGNYSATSIQKEVVNHSKQGVECILCHCSFLTRQGYSIHVKRSHQNTNYPCAVCGVSTANRAAMITHGQWHIEKGVFLCLMCHNREFEDQDTLLHHLSRHIECVKFLSYCPQCETPLWNVEEAFEHLKIEHGIKSYSCDECDFVSNSVQSLEKHQSMKHCEENLSCHLCKSIFHVKEKLKEHLSKEHNLDADKSSSLQPPIKIRIPVNPIKSKASENIYNISDNKKSEIPAKRQTLEYTCAKCNLKTQNRTEFQEHIITHKSNKTTFQCQECGVCFVVEPSLRKHLIIVHKISDVEKYLAEEGTNCMPETEVPSESSSHNALECSVCLTTFPSETALKTHLRSHGMAFIQAKKTGST